MIVCTELRSRILEILGETIGTYRYSDGYEEEAIAVLPDDNGGWDIPGNGTRTEGIEVIITRPVPQVNYFLNDGKQLTHRWIVTLKQWDSSKSLIEPMITLIQGLDYLISSPKLVPPNAALGIIEQCNFSITEYEFQRSSA